MYYLAYGFFYLISLLPFPVIYRLSDLLFIILYHLFGYRKELVLSHLNQTFPEKTEQERQRICKAFFRNFCDVWFEMIKIISMSKEVAAKRIQCDFQLLNKYYEQGKSVQIVGGHFMNWEYINVSLPLFQPYTPLAIYMPLSNKVMERLVFYIRSRFGMVLLKAGQLSHQIKEWKDKPYAMVVGADQSPSNPGAAYWLWFCNKPAGFIDGPWKRAVTRHEPYVYFSIRKLRRGFYTFSIRPFEENPMHYTSEQLVLKYAQLLEQEIRATPENYLWTHKRWKKGWKAEYATQWVDERPLPEG